MNLMTEAMQKLTDMVIATDTKLKEYGKEPYGQRELTEKEERDRFENLTPQGLLTMVDEKGPEEVNKWLQKFMPKEEINA